MRTPSSSTWRARWRASRSRSWRSEPCSGQQPSGPFSPGQPEARALQTHPAHLTTAVTRPRWGAGRGPKPRVWSVRLVRPPAPAMELQPKRLGKGPCACWILIYCPPFYGAQGPGPPGLCRSLPAPGATVQSPPLQSIHPEGPEDARPCRLASLRLLSGRTERAISFIRGRGRGGRPFLVRNLQAARGRSSRRYPQGFPVSGQQAVYRKTFSHCVISK